MYNNMNLARRKMFAKSVKLIALLSLGSFISGCNDSDEEPIVIPPQATVNFVLAPVEGGSCSVLDPGANMAVLAGPVVTSQGRGVFEDVPANAGLVVLECSGGSYVDEATGDTMTPGSLRAYVNVTSSEFTATVSPLTEITARLLDYYELTPQDYASVLTNVAFSFGLKDIDPSAVTPLDISLAELDGTASGNYGLVLAALSQMQVDQQSDSADDIMNELVDGLANNGLFTSDEIRDLYFNGLHNMFDNPLIEPNLGSDDNLDVFFHDVVLAPVASQVDYVDAFHPDSNNAAALTTIDGFEESTFDIIGTHLSLKMEVTLGGERCRTKDLATESDTNSEFRYNSMIAICTPQNLGQVDLVVMDQGRLENTTAITVVEPGTFDYGAAGVTAGTARKASLAKSTNPSTSATTGSSFVFGFVTGQVPAINPSVSSAHDYTTTKLQSFNISGVTVDLVNAQNAVLATTTTEQDGYYLFENVPESTSVSVVVKAEIKKVRTTPNVGPQYSFAVRDNTSISTPRTMYTLSTPFFTTLAEGNSDNPQQDIIAKIGFNSSGSLISEDQRESAPFAILRTMKAAADQLTLLNANLIMPSLEVYWSGKNIGSEGDKEKGQIGTSHYNGHGILPGLYILGKADSDTDEFDQGVIGHEFGHFLQDKLSYSDSPGGSHSDNEHKDASLAYGEGYGTAIGGLLSGSKYYCDVSGESQLDGFCIDLTDKDAAGNVKGFYSEASVITLMYGIGTIPGKGIGEFFTAVSEMKSDMHSATIFSFLHHYLKANPDVKSQIETLMSENNVKSSDPFGIYPTGTPADASIGEANNKKGAQQGADDLDKIYIQLTLNNAEEPFANDPPAQVTPNATSFCVNRNLPGANSFNGLGMRRRLVFTANFTGDILIRAVNKYDHLLSDQSSKLEIRDQDGKNLELFDYSGVDATKYYGLFTVVSGKQYSIKFSMENPEAVLNGSQCGIKVELARPGS